MKFLRRQLAALAVLAALLANCGDDGPTAAGPIDVSGSWGGVVFVFQNDRDSIAFTVEQAPDGHVNGSGAEHFFGIEVPLTVSGRVEGQAVSLSFTATPEPRVADPSVFTGAPTGDALRGTYVVGPFRHSVTFRRIR